MNIDQKYSINRVKRARDYAHREHFNKRRAARLWIDCHMWLGTWGV